MNVVLFFCMWHELSFLQVMQIVTGCLKKLSFAKLSIWRSSCQLGGNTYDICGKSANAHIGKTEIFRHPVVRQMSENFHLRELSKVGKLIHGPYGKYFFHFEALH